jgi:dynein heavy chain
LLEIEGVMIETLKKVTKTAVEDESPRVDWVKKWPAQTVLGVNMIRWTIKAEDAINNGTIKDYVQDLVLELKDVVGLVRTDLSALDRLTLSALVTIDVHNKDVVQSLVDENCSNIQDFSWIAQMRYYWIN